MRAKDDCSYNEYKDGVLGAFHLLGERGYQTPEDVTNYIVDEDIESDSAVRTSIALELFAIGEYEVRNNLLEDRVLEQLSYHIPRFKMGKYDDDLTPEEHQQIEKDIDFILSKVKLYEGIDLSDDEDSDI